jgi:autoinducer 2-degrading protein
MMYVVSVTVFVEPGHADDFIQAVLDNARHTRGEPGNVRFDVSRCIDDPNRFLLYEVYRNETDFRAHQQTEHYLRWRETVAGWMARPRQGVKHTSLFPDDEIW